MVVMWPLSHLFILITSFSKVSSLQTSTLRPRFRLPMIQRSIPAFLDATASSKEDRAAIDSFLAATSDCENAEYVLCLEGDSSRLSRTMTKSKHYIVQGTKLVDQDTKANVGAVVAVDTTAGQNLALSLISECDWLILTAWDPEVSLRMISACEGLSTKVALLVDSTRLSWMPTILFSLRPAAVVLMPNSKHWSSYLNLLKSADHKQLYLKDYTPSISGTDINREQRDSCSNNLPVLIEGTVVSVRSGGIGDRVCLDLISLLHEGEGLLIGSDPNLLAFVHAETFATEFVPARPFRVNAGSLHACVLLADGSTKYLCEVTTGDQVAVVSVHSAAGTGTGTGSRAGGHASWRPVAVGRCKTESRPMLLVEYETTTTPSRSGTVFLQQAETVRLVAPSSSDRGPSVQPPAGSSGPALGEEAATAVTFTPTPSTSTDGTDVDKNNVPSFRRWKPLSVTQASIGDTIFLSAASNTN